jgi:hypothetical protein
MEQSQPQVLLVTDEGGRLHIVPKANKAIYLSRNQASRRNLYSGFREMAKADALKFVEDNNGKDPTFRRPAEIETQLRETEKENELLKSQLAEFQKNQAPVDSNSPKIKPGDKLK